MKIQQLIRRLRVVAVIALLGMGTAGFVGCADETSTGEIEEIPIPDDEQEQEEEEQEEQEEKEYTTGVLDGVWDLEFADSEEKFSEFTIVHNLDESLLVVSFETPDDGGGDLSSATWKDDQFTGEWAPYPESNPNEVFRITRSEFVQGDDNRIEGLISGSVTIDFKDFVMKRVK